MSDFQQELTQLLNKYSRENASNTPDHILAQFLFRVMKAYEMATNKRDAWHGDKIKNQAEQKLTAKLNSYPKEIEFELGNGLPNIKKGLVWRSKHHKGIFTIADLDSCGSLVVERSLEDGSKPWNEPWTMGQIHRQFKEGVFYKSFPSGGVTSAKEKALDADAIAKTVGDIFDNVISSIKLQKEARAAMASVKQPATRAEAEQFVERLKKVAADHGAEAIVVDAQGFIFECTCGCNGTGWVKMVNDKPHVFEYENNRWVDLGPVREEGIPQLWKMKVSPEMEERIRKTIMPPKVEKVVGEHMKNESPEPPSALDEKGFFFETKCGEIGWCRMNGERPWFFAQDIGGWYSVKAVDQIDVWNAKASEVKDDRLAKLRDSVKDLA